MRRRPFSLVLAAVVTLALVWQILDSTSAQAQVVVVDRDLAALMPPGTMSLLGVDVARITEAPLYQYLENEGGGAGKGFGGAIDNFVDVSGFDPRRHVDRLLVASWGEPAQFTMSSDLPFLAVARGRFDVVGLGEILARTSTESTEYRGLGVYHFKNGDDAPPSEEGDKIKAPDPMWFSLSFLDGTTAVVGPRELVIEALDRRFDGGPSLAENTALLGLAETIESKNQIWGVSEQPGKLMPEEGPEGTGAQELPATRILKTMQQSTFALDLMDGLDFKAEGLFTTAEDAKLLGDAARGLLAMGRLTIGAKNPGLIIFLDSIGVTESGTKVRFSIDMDALNFEKMIEALKATQAQTVQG